MSSRCSVSTDSLQFLDTSVVRSIITGDRHARAYYASRLGNKRYVTDYIVMEFLRGFVHVVAQVVVIASMDHIDGVLHAAQTYANKYPSRQTSAVLGFVTLLMQSFQDDSLVSLDKRAQIAIACRYVRRLASKVFGGFLNTGQDATRCKRAVGHQWWGSSEFDDIRSWIEEFEDTAKARSACSIERFLFDSANGELLEIANSEVSERNVSVQRHRESVGKLLMRTRRELAKDSKRSKITCNTCAGIGDSIIAVQCPATFELHTVDHSFDHLMLVLGKTHVRHPHNGRITEMASESIDRSGDSSTEP